MSFFRPSASTNGRRNSQVSSRPVSRVPSQRLRSPNSTTLTFNFDTVHSPGLLASTAASRAKSISPNSSTPSPAPSIVQGNRSLSICSVDPNDPDGTVYRFNRLLNKPHTSKIYRTKADIEEALKRLRRYILAEGIPTELVSGRQIRTLGTSYDIYVTRIPPFAHGYGRLFCKWIQSMLLRIFVTSAKAPVQSVKRFETIHLGKCPPPLPVPL